MNKIQEEGEEIIPSKIVCVGRNYVEHIKELKNEIPSSMVIFMKPNSSISEKLDTKGKELHYEGEISFLIKNSKISSVGFGLDLTDRSLQGELKSKGLPWERAKAFDGAGVFSEFVKLDEKDISSLNLKLYINDKLAQSGGVELMIYKPDFVIGEISTFTTLEDGDIVMSGTPKGVGIIKQGDRFKAEVFIGNRKIIEKFWIAI
ncbi:MAG: fumarylacetoacetate hydrolase family protein [Epsilonproteobacteria bacterium]|nr:fumarylacetoacetate hydrolase family protein [Campylobacterota bacterium]